MTETHRRPNMKIVGVFAVVFCIAVSAFFWKLGVSAIANADEGVHALVTREIRERPDWLTMHIRGEYYFRKPPLAFWIRAVSQTAFGESEFATRLPSALAGVATTMLLAVWAWHWTRRLTTVLAVGAIYPLLPSTFVHTFRTGETDGTLIFLLTLTAYLLWRSLKRPWLVVAAAVTTGLALMTKSVAAGTVPIAFVVTLAIVRRWPYTWKQLFLAAAAFVVIAAPWHIIEHVRHGSTFWNEYLGEHVIERVEERLHVTPKTHGPLWYFSAFERGMYPWSWLVVPAIVAALLRRRANRDGDITGIFLIAWGVGTVVLFSLAATKLAWYIAPAFPACSLLVARFITEPWRSRSALLLMVSAVAAAWYIVTTASEFQTGFAGIVSGSFLLDWGWVHSHRVYSFLGFVAAAAAVWILTLKNTWRTVTLVVLLGHVALFSLIVFSRNIRSTYESPFRLVRNAVVAQDPTAEIFVFPIGYVTSPLSAMYLEGPKHARKVTPLRENQDVLQNVVAENSGSFIIFDREHPAPEVLLENLSFVNEFGDLRLFRIL